MKDNLVLFGPTASGKSALALALAKRFDGEILNMDSMQIYRGMDIATAKPTWEERKSIPHHLFDIADPDEAFSAFDYKQYAHQAIEDVRRRGKTPILVGGTGLYLSSLYYDFVFRPRDEQKRKALEKIYEEEGIKTLEAMARRDFPELLRAIDKDNPHRLLRLLESGEVHEEKRRSNLPLKLIILETNREFLALRMEKRIETMHEAGLLDEIRRLYALYPGMEYLPSLRGIGYKEYLPFLRGEITLEEAKERHLIHTRRYAKRQRTWARHQYPDAFFIQAEQSLEEKMKQIEEQWR